MSKKVQVATGKRGGRIAGYSIKDGKMKPVYVDDRPGTGTAEKKSPDIQVGDFVKYGDTKASGALIRYRSGSVVGFEGDKLLVSRGEGNPPAVVPRYAVESIEKSEKTAPARDDGPLAGKTDQQKLEWHRGVLLRQSETAVRDTLNAVLRKRAEDDRSSGVRSFYNENVPADDHMRLRDFKVDEKTGTAEGFWRDLDFPKDDWDDRDEDRAWAYCEQVKASVLKRLGGKASLIKNIEVYSGDKNYFQVHVELKPIKLVKKDEPQKPAETAAESPLSSYRASDVRVGTMVFHPKTGAPVQVTKAQTIKALNEKRLTFSDGTTHTMGLHGGRLVPAPGVLSPAEAAQREAKVKEMVKHPGGYTGAQVEEATNDWFAKNGARVGKASLIKNIEVYSGDKNYFQVHVELKPIKLVKKDEPQKPAETAAESPLSSYRASDVRVGTMVFHPKTGAPVQVTKAQTIKALNEKRLTFSDGTTHTMGLHGGRLVPAPGVLSPAEAAQREAKVKEMVKHPGGYTGAQVEEATNDWFAKNGARVGKASLRELINHAGASTNPDDVKAVRDALELMVKQGKLKKYGDDASKGNGYTGLDGTFYESTTPPPKIIMKNPTLISDGPTSQHALDVRRKIRREARAKNAHRLGTTATYAGKDYEVTRVHSNGSFTIRDKENGTIRTGVPEFSLKFADGAETAGSERGTGTPNPETAGTPKASASGSHHDFLTAHFAEGGHHLDAAKELVKRGMDPTKARKLARKYRDLKKSLSATDPRSWAASVLKV